MSSRAVIVRPRRRSPPPRGPALVGFCAALIATGCLDPGERPVSGVDLGINALAEQRFDWARVHFRAALADTPEDTEALGGACLAWSSGVQQSLSETIVHCRRYLDAVAPAADPAPTLLERDDAIERLIDALARSGAADQARAWAPRLGDPARRSVIGAELWLDADPERSLGTLDDLFADARGVPAPLLARAHTAAGEADLRLGHVAAAGAGFERALAARPLDARLHYRLSRLALRAGDREVSARDTERFRALERLATRVGPEAPSDVERLRILDRLDDGFPRDHPQVRVAEARWALRAGFVERGMAVLEVLDAEGALADDERVELAELLIGHGRAEQARAWLGPILSRHPDHRRARVGLIAATLGAGELQAARSLIEEGLRRDPRLARYHHLMARLVTAEGDVGAADAFRARALALSPWNLGLRLEVADRLLARGARAATARLIAAAPEPSPRLDAYRRANRLDGAAR